MDEARYKLFYDFSRHLSSTRRYYDKRGRYMEHVAAFLEEADTVDRKGYNRFKKRNAELIGTTCAAEAICELLAFAGKGYRGRTGIRRVRPLESLSAISEKNMELISRFVSSMTEDEDYSPCTVASYALSMRQYFSYATVFTLENCKRFVASLEAEGKKPRTINLRITALERFAKWLKKPVSLRRLKIRKSLSIENVPSEADYNRLLDYLRNDKGNRDYYYHVRIMGTTGARVSECLQLTWEDILRGERVLKGKGNKYRRIFFTKGLQREVAEYVRRYGKKGLVYVNRLGLPLSSRGLASNLKTWGAACGIAGEKMHPHAFRHFFAKMFLKKTGGDITQLADLLGHGNIEITRTYLQRSYNEQQRDYNRSVTW